MINHQSWEVYLLGNQQLGLIQLKNKWECPVCHLQFKYDIQLLRHQRKQNHYNPDRQERRKKRAMKALGKGRQVQPDGRYRCRFCLNIFTKKQRCRHYRYCQKSIKQKKTMDENYINNQEEDNLFQFNKNISSIQQKIDSLQQESKKSIIQSNKLSKIQTKQFKKYRNQDFYQIQQDNNLSVSNVQYIFRQFQDDQ